MFYLSYVGVSNKSTKNISLFCCKKLMLNEFTYSVALIVCSFYKAHNEFKTWLVLLEIVLSFSRVELVLKWNRFLADQPFL